ncbi:hypothetical protein TWF569_009165 [Orbilia oligospora]|uniref:Uncharacterized protein n=1 Tax=Orbilia oligospora TaxID=2813651 RepID=A0A7C8J5S0_ORBOL|nr:hypothetical protein TWF102_002579 [Orbilia oligospora]KAF3100235.1 hypothetical protein TWF103_008260 [Orbilia oligospora]KAF3109426.1 hypothetical protein TWF706_001299 [Orbilia oligospora]KAF3137724.1 hypothetical protein TWF569_009165 [Orbilia oligospora]KAF3145785.1 hypothetical protein TWF594_003772 [Orbilia oligospora]
MTSDVSTSTSTRPFDEPTPFHKAARDGTGNPQLLLEKLPAMLHGVMIQCADVFKHPARSHPRAILHTNAQMKATIPATVDRFQQALDMLEIEILKAKAVLHRDLTKFYTAAELARQKELEEEERKAALEREAEAERLRILKQSEEAEKQAAAEAEAAAAAAAAAAATAAANAAAAEAALMAVPTISTDLEMTLDDDEPPPSAQPLPMETQDTDMDQLFEDMQDVESLKVEEDASVPPQQATSTSTGTNATNPLSHPLEMNIPLVAASASNVISLDDDDNNKNNNTINTATTKLDGKIKPDSSPSLVAATFEDPIILDSPLLPAGEGEEDGEPPSAVDLFGDDPLNPVGESSSKDGNGVGGVSGGNMTIEEQIDMDFLFAGNPSNPADGSGVTSAVGGGGGVGTTGNNGGAHETSVDDLFGDLEVDASGDAGKLDIMNLDIPGLEKEAGKVGGDDAKKVTGQDQPDIDITQALEGGSFDDLLASFDLGQLGNDETSLFDDAFNIYEN